MKNFKKIISLLTLGIMTSFAVFVGFVAPQKNTAHATEPDPDENLSAIEKSVVMTDSERNVEVTLVYKTMAEVGCSIDFEIAPEHNKEKLEVFQKYVKKAIDSADVGEVFYVTAIPSDKENNNLVNGSYSFKVKLPKFYHNKELAVIPFTDYRTTQRTKPAEVDDDGYITFTGNSSAYAYAIVYNGVYKEIILIGIIMFVILAICVVVKVYCLRKDNPDYKEKKKQKAIQNKKDQHKINKRLAQELKREKEKLKKKGK